MLYLWEKKHEKLGWIIVLYCEWMMLWHDQNGKSLNINFLFRISIQRTNQQHRSDLIHSFSIQTEILMIGFIMMEWKKQYDGNAQRDICQLNLCLWTKTFGYISHPNLSSTFHRKLIPLEIQAAVWYFRFCNYLFIQSRSNLVHSVLSSHSKYVSQCECQA